MHVILFIIIAYALRHRFLDEDDGKWGEILYYGLSAAWTPLIGIPLFVMIKKSKPMTEKDDIFLAAWLVSWACRKAK